jgi:hypothetical protein
MEQSSFFMSVLIMCYLYLLCPDLAKEACELFSSKHLIMTFTLTPLLKESKNTKLSDFANSLWASFLLRVLLIISVSYSYYENMIGTVVGFCVWQGEDWGLNSGFHACKAGAIQSILLWLFWTLGLATYLPWLAWNGDTPNLSLQVARITGLSHQAPAVFHNF